MPAIDKETAFADLIKNYEDQWVAIDEREGVEFVVGHGKDAVEAARDAESKRFPNAMLCKVPSFHSSFIPLSDACYDSYPVRDTVDF